MIPKFRAFIKDTKQMIDVEFLDLSHKVLIGKHWEFGMTEAIKFDDVELMQSTGFKDKHGAEIFEGDVLKCTSTDGSFWYETVLWDETLSGFETQQKGYDAITISYIMDSKALKVEVVGNIYENSELLEEK